MNRLKLAKKFVHRVSKSDLGRIVAEIVPIADAPLVEKQEGPDRKKTIHGMEKVDEHTENDILL